MTTTARAWADYERRNALANDEYAEHPLTTCLGIIAKPDGTTRPCTATQGKKDNLCRRCRKCTAEANRKKKTA